LIKDRLTTVEKLGVVDAIAEQTTRATAARAERLRQELQRALDGDGLELHYQPIVDLIDGRMTGAEALLRWEHPELGRISPGEVIPLAEESGLIVPLGQWVLERACRQRAEWTELGLTLPITINVSARQLVDERFALAVHDALERYGIEPSTLCLEVTEGVFLQPEGATLAVLETLKQLGVFLAVDDFGTGYSSLAQLKQLPIEVVKIDRAFVDGLGTDPGDSAIVASIMSLAHAMGLHVVAEGVETEPQARELRALGCLVAQGYLYAPALPPPEVVTLSRSQGAPPAAHAFGRSRWGAPPAVGPHRRARRILVEEFMEQIGIRVAGT
jgi:diguanylate cyclase